MTPLLFIQGLSLAFSPALCKNYYVEMQPFLLSGVYKEEQ